MTAFSSSPLSQQQDDGQVTTMMSQYGAIDQYDMEDQDDINNNNNIMDGGLSALQQQPRTASLRSSKTMRRAIIALSTVPIVLLLLLVVATTTTSIPSMLYQYMVGQGSVAGTPPGHEFEGPDWRSWAMGVREYWDEKRMEWQKEKAELQAKNATVEEKKEAKALFWNSTASEFGGGIRPLPAWLNSNDNGGYDNDDNDDNKKK